MHALPFLYATAFFRDFVTNSCVVWYYALFAHIWYRVPVKPSRALIGMLSLFSVHVITHYVIGGSIVSTGITALGMLLLAWILWRPMRGFRFWSCFGFCAVTEFAWEFIIAFGALRLFPDPEMLTIGNAQVYAFAPETTPAVILLDAAALGLPLLVFKSLRDLRTKRAPRRDGRVYIMNMVALLLLVVCLMAIFAFNGELLMRSRESRGDVPGVLSSNAPFFIVYALAIVLLVFYGWQSIQQYLLYLNNRTLRDQNNAYQRIVDDTREFRHNISNMLYGFEGVLLTRDLTEIENYYDEMLKRCILINNENANALNRIQSPALTALLLRKLDRAAELEIPCYLNVSPGFSFDAMPATRLSEALGNLLDNALEAAAKAEVRRVNLTLNHTDQYDEILLSNTFAADADLSFLGGGGGIRSSKPDHQATGLDSARRILQRHPDVCFNQYLQGRYVETCLCVYR